MGITGLLPLLTPVSTSVHIKEYAGKTVAIDGHCWLHKGAFSCAMELALKQPTTKYVTHFKKMIQMLQFYKVIPLVVFDGKALPMKQETNQKRAERRKKALEAGMKHIALGQRKEAMGYFQQSVSVSEAMVQEVIKSLDQMGVKSIIAPYEADPQLAYVLKKGYAQAIVTEDSDLLAFGCATVIFKLNPFGEGTRICFKDIENVMDIHPFDVSTLRHVCMLSGCDYLSSLKGIGLKTAISLVRRNRETAKIMKTLRFKSDIAVYAEQFPRAESAFLYQYVYDAPSRRFVRLNNVPESFNQDYLYSLGSCPPTSDTTVPKVYMSPQEVKSNKENIPPWLKFEKTKETDVKQAKQEPSNKTGSVVERFKQMIQNKVKETKPTPLLVRGYSFSDSLPSLTSSASSEATQEEPATDTTKTPLSHPKRPRDSQDDLSFVGRKRVLGTITNTHAIL
ncbi:PIN domain-like protein [Sporodiniella umbellata]|nr:PIN domain-like protein [Sporodiniella umbellata]